MILYYLCSMIISVLPLIPLVVAVRAAYFAVSTRKFNIYHEVGLMLLVLLLGAVFIQTIDMVYIFKNGFQRKGSINLTPFYEIKRFLQSNSIHSFINLVGNVVVFIPFGLLPPILWRNMGRLPFTLFSGFLISLFIECMQLFTPRATDVDDLILNTLGVLTGYCLFLVIQYIFPQTVNRFKVSREKESAVEKS